MSACPQAIWSMTRDRPLLALMVTVIPVSLPMRLIRWFSPSLSICLPRSFKNSHSEAARGLALFFPCSGCQKIFQGLSERFCKTDDPTLASFSTSDAQHAVLEVKIAALNSLSRVAKRSAGISSRRSLRLT